MGSQKCFTPEPLAFFLTWTTYGSWLPGDERGWADDDGALREPSVRLARSAAQRMKGSAVVLTLAERSQVLDTISKHCHHCQWKLLAASCRTQHVHVVVSAPKFDSATVSQQLKAWTARVLAGSDTPRRRVWTKGCSRRRIYDERDLAAVVQYVAECQEKPRR